MVDRHEKERAGWVAARAGRRNGARRRAELLNQAVRKNQIRDSGASETGFVEVTTPNFITRFIRREEGAGNQISWAIMLFVFLVIVGVLLGPGILLAWALYGVWRDVRSGIGSPKRSPLIIAALIIGVLGYLGLRASALHGWSLSITCWVWINVIFGLLWTARLVHVWGWAGVSRKARTNKARVSKIDVGVAKKDVDDHYVISKTAPAQPEELEVSIDLGEDSR